MINYSSIIITYRHANRRKPCKRINNSINICKYLKYEFLKFVIIIEQFVVASSSIYRYLQNIKINEN